MAPQPPATVPESPDLFIGLVTHAGSRFSDSATEEGLGRTITRTLRARGLSVAWSVSDKDQWTPDLLPIDRAEVVRSIDAELDVEGRWRSYVSGRHLSPRERLTLAARRVWRRATMARPGKRVMGDDDPGFRATRRLANIELSHLTLMQEAVDSRARWSLILEDDAWAANPEDFADQLASFLRSREEAPQPTMVSLSESFTPAQLGIEHLLTPLPRDDNRIVGDNNGIPWSLWQVARPVTNTVCATLYRREFLTSMVGTLGEIPLSPVVPIDFKLNEALMRLAPTTRPGDCWLAHPAPLEQRSGVPKV